ncbi:transcriptional regulator, AraC family [Rhodopirellula maiorica SM1]|uniref:Transcriptional regulator, AraC family n=1 Tax=Rhodopirellula maiorica SM1 TaxID=1265738 RepID=M5RC21_9BACT|nr:helix-turn-helix domain-containing protein [Rhodopirellula maiorica]EMI16616.1 transcriptional regulator, AraC family [Rhodopirellula maiorica SM1]
MENTRLREDFFAQLGPSDQAFALFDHLPGLSFFVKDRQGRFIALNRRGCEYCGVVSEAEAIGKTDHDFFPKSRADEYHADDVAVMESGEAIVNRVESAPEDAGSPRLVMTSKVPLRDRRGRVIGVAGFSRQIERIQTPSGTVDAFANVIAHLHAHFADNLSTQQLADMAGLSVSHFERRFRHAFGASPRQYLVRVRIEHAAKLLRETEQTVSEVAHACGFYDHAHFSRSFRRLMNCSPSQYKS